MNKQSREALDAYYAEADSWSKDRQDSLRASRRLAWIVALSAVAIAVLEAIALLVLMPLKTVEPYTLLVDRNTGYVQALSPVDPGLVAPDSALTQSFLVQYVTARETFDANAIQANYRKVGLWSAETARSSYMAGQQASNPDSPLVIYPRTTVVETRVKSVSAVGDNVAMVRFDTQRRDAGGQVEPPRAWAAIVRYRYSGEPMSIEDRFVNPLGFQVVHYRRDPEALPPEPAPVAVPEPPQVVVQPVVRVPVPVRPQRRVAPAPVQPQRPAVPEPEL
jgi:type IV secretion system protein VirB8